MAYHYLTIPLLLKTFHHFADTIIFSRPPHVTTHPPKQCHNCHDQNRPYSLASFGQFHFSPLPSLSCQLFYLMSSSATASRLDAPCGAFRTCSVCSEDVNVAVRVAVTCPVIAHKQVALPLLIIEINLSDFRKVWGDRFISQLLSKL